MSAAVQQRVPRPRCGCSRAGFEDGVDLGAILENFPGAGKARGHDESIAGPECTALARLALDHNTPSGDHAQLVLGIAHAPLAARSRPATGEELLTRVGEVIPHAMLGRAGDQAVK